MPRKPLYMLYNPNPFELGKGLPLSLPPAGMGAGEARKRVKGLAPCGFGQGPRSWGAPARKRGEAPASVVVGGEAPFSAGKTQERSP